MRRRDKAGGKAAKTQRRKTLKRRNAPKAARRRSSSAAGKKQMCAAHPRAETRRWSSRRRPPRCSRSSAVRPANLAGLRSHAGERGCGFARPNSAHLPSTTARLSQRCIAAMRRRHMPNSMSARLPVNRDPHICSAELCWTSKCVHIADISRRSRRTQSAAHIARNAAAIGPCLACRCSRTTS